MNVTSNTLTLTLDTSALQDPTGTPTGTASATGGALPAGNNYARIVGVDPTGNTTEAGSESAAVVTTGTTSQIAWAWPAISGAVSYRIYPATTAGAETTYFTTNTNSFTQTVAAGTLPGTPPVTNTTSVDVPNNLNLMVGVKLHLADFGAATFLNGQTITIASVLPGGQNTLQITAAFTHGNYTSASDTGTATSGSGITGSSQPSWATARAAVTQDGGAQWINRGSNVQNWGIAAPANAPSIYTSPVTPLYPYWAANTTYWPSLCVYDSGFIFKITTPGTTGGSAPTFNHTTIGDTTTDGTVVWTYVGVLAWAATTSYVKGAYTSFSSGGEWVYIAQNAGTSGAAQTAWPVGAGATVQDGGVVWLCLGKLWDYAGSNNGAFTPNAALSASNIIIDTNGYMQTIQDNSNDNGPFISSTNQPSPWGAVGAFTSETLTATITQYQISANQAIITADNRFLVDELVTIAGLTTGTYLNGVDIGTLLTSSASDFIFAFTHADDGPTSDSGTATILEGAMWLNTGAFAPVSTSPKFYAYAYKSSVTQHVSSASKISAAVLLRAGSQANVQGFGSADPQVDTIVLYATTQGGSTLLEMDEIANPGGGVPWTYLDNVPDTSLNFEVTAAINGANNPPPDGFLPSAYHLGRIWGFVGNKLIYSGGPDTLTGSGNEAFPPNNYFFMPETLTRLWPSSIGLIIHGTANVYVETGLGTAGNPFIPPPVFQEGVGLLNYDALTINGSTMYMMTSTARIISFDPGAGELEVGQPIGDQFTNLYDPATAFLTFHEGSSEDLGLYVGDAAQGWFRMGVLASPESGNVWSPQRVIAAISQTLTITTSQLNSVLTNVQGITMGFSGGATLTVGEAVTFEGTGIAGLDGKTLEVAGAPWPAPSAGLATFVIGKGGINQISPIAATGTMAVNAGCGMLQSVEVSPGVKTLLIGPNVSGPILQRDYSTNEDNGTPYAMNAIIGSLLLCQPGTEAEVEFVTLDSILVLGSTRPTVGLLLGELSGYAASPSFTLLVANSNDLPLLPAAFTLYSDRYDMAQNQNQQSCRHLQMQISWAKENAANELLTHTIFGTLRPEA